MTRFLILTHISISLLWVLGMMKLRQHFGLPIANWTLVLTVVFYWLGVLTKRNRVK